MAYTFKRKKMTLSERLYIPELIRGLLITFRNFFSRKVTMQYPEERWHTHKGYRGFPYLVMGDNGIEKCVACKLCERICPADVIYIEIDEYENPDIRERRPKVFNVDMGKCIVCGYCEEACPVDAIRMSDEYELSRYTREELLFDKEMLLSDYKQLTKEYRDKEKRKKVKDK